MYPLSVHPTRFIASLIVARIFTLAQSRSQDLYVILILIPLLAADCAELDVVDQEPTITYAIPKRATFITPLALAMPGSIPSQHRNTRPRSTLHGAMNEQPNKLGNNSRDL